MLEPPDPPVDVPDPSEFDRFNPVTAANSPSTLTALLIVFVRFKLLLLATTIPIPYPAWTSLASRTPLKRLEPRLEPLLLLKSDEQITKKSIAVKTMISNEKLKASNLFICESVPLFECPPNPLFEC